MKTVTKRIIAIIILIMCFVFPAISSAEIHCPDCGERELFHINSADKGFVFNSTQHWHRILYVAQCWNCGMVVWYVNTKPQNHNHNKTEIVEFGPNDKRIKHSCECGHFYYTYIQPGF